jgi:uncharacterized membrane protein YhdT
MTTKTSSGVGFTGLLTIVFIVLKLTGVVNWSWWWVLSPMYIPIVLLLLVLLVIALIAGLISIYENYKENNT